MTSVRGCLSWLNDVCLTGLVKALFRIFVKGQFGVEKACGLGYFAICKVSNDLRDELDDFDVLQICQEPRRLGKQEIASKDGDSCSVQAIDGLLSPANVALVQYIVMDQ